jgi:RNA polymerase sigma-70 factor (ECF subfamily)
MFMAESGRLRRIAAGMGLGASDVEDVLQDVSMRVLKKAPEGLGRDEVVRWLIRVTVNACLAEHRRRKRFRRRAEEILSRIAPAKKGPDEAAIEAEELEIVRAALQGLDGSLLGVMVLRYFDGMKSNEIGQVLSLNASTVRSRLREGRMILAKRLLDKGVRP